MKRDLALAGLLCVATLATGVEPAFAHGLAGKRFFPATLVIDDPFVADELTFPSVFHIKTPAKGDEPAARQTDISADLSKRITPNLGLSGGGTLTNLDPEESPAVAGFQNLDLGVKYQFFKSEPHELILSLGLGVEVGGTGRKAVGADSFSRLTPALFYGKGLGDLPDSLSFLKPLGLTGVLGVNMPTRAKTTTVRGEGDEAEVEIERNPNVFQWGFAVEYSIPYLQSFVRDVGLPAPFNRMIPVVELSFETALGRGQGGQTTGTVNPGIIWAGRSLEIGIEAVVPVNTRTGKNVGVGGLLHFFLDDLFPNSFGRPIFGK